MENLIPKTQIPKVDLSWVHKTNKLAGSQEDNQNITPLAMDSRDKSSNLTEEHKIIVVLN